MAVLTACGVPEKKLLALDIYTTGCPPHSRAQSSRVLLSHGQPASFSAHLVVGMETGLPSREYGVGSCSCLDNGGSTERRTQT